MTTEERILLQRRFFESGKTLDIDFRIKQLKALKEAIKNNESAILAALHSDLGKAEFEGYATEVGLMLEEISYTIKHLRKWAKPVRVKTPLVQFLSSAKIYSEPFGVALIMSPWNYPFQLTIAPVIGAMCAGNCAVIKPSDYSSETSKIIEKIINENFDPGYLTVVMGGREANATLLSQKFDYIFFTGGVTVGKLVMQSAAAHLTPVTLELGGKSPCFVDETANIPLAAKRIAWGKFLNSGQTCVAPDYLLVHKSVKKALCDKIIENIKLFYGENPLESPDFGKIITKKHFDRLSGLIASGEILHGGRSDESKNKIEPTLLNNVSFDSPVMTEEIFGPVLPIIEYEDLKSAVKQVQSRAKPLAGYVFTSNKENEKHILSHLSFGGGCVNDTVVHQASSFMPFGGVGESGMGGYHGKGSFDTFSHKKSILKKSNLIDIPVRYAPYKNKLSLVKKIMK